MSVSQENKHFLWSRGEELITDKFPELACLADHLPNGTVVDGELLPYKEGEIGNFNALQKRIGRKRRMAVLCTVTEIIIYLRAIIMYLC